MIFDRTKPDTVGKESRTNDTRFPLPGLMDYMYLIDTCSIDNIFGCDENCSIPVRQEAQTMGSASRPTGGSRVANTLSGNDQQQIDDYAKRHDTFLDSLLYEQVHLRRAPQNEAELNESAIGLNSSMSSNTTHSDGVSLHSSRSDVSAAKNDRKASFAVRLKRRTHSSPCRSISSAPSVVETEANIRIDRSRTFELDTISEVEHQPSHFIHLHCRIQKDSGRGEDVGAKVCGKGRDQCLQKLRAKMKLLTEHAMPIPGESKKGPATMKRRNARVSAKTDAFVETRSMIELRMGFLSMTYGVLLRWDYRSTGQINLIVLRKSCHEAFYPKDSIITNNKPFTRIDDKVNVITPAPKASESATSTAVINAASIKAPYRIPRPDVFEPKRFHVTVLYAIGLHPKSTWTVQLLCGGKIEIIKLKHDLESCCYVPQKANKLETTFPVNVKFPSVDVKLFEQRPRRKHLRCLVATMNVPITDLELQSSSTTKPVRLRVPCQHDQAASIQLEILTVSDYDNWVKREIEARRLEEAQVIVRLQSSKSKVDDVSPQLRPMDIVDELENVDNDNEQNEDRWDWICCIC